jgi:hypothetical protein
MTTLLHITPNILINYNTEIDRKYIKTQISSIEEIVNKISLYICNGKNNDYIIENLKSEYEKICLIHRDGADNCANADRVFKDNKINKIINEIRNKKFYLKLCKFKINTPNYLLLWPTTELVWPRVYTMYGGNKKLIDFDNFIKQYEYYYKVDNNLINIKISNIMNNSNNISKQFELNNINLSLDTFNKISYDINLESAYILLKRLHQLTHIQCLYSEIKLLLKYLHLFILPFKIVKKANKIYNTIINNY